MVGKLNYSLFIGLPSNIKAEFVRIFNIPRNGRIHVVDNVVQADGYLNEDLEKIDVPVLQKHLKSEEADFFKLLTETIDRIKVSLEPKKEVSPAKEEKKIVVNINVDGENITTTVDKPKVERKPRKTHVQETTPETQI